MEKNGTSPAIVWLKVTDYMHGWLQYELGGSLRIMDQLVVCVQHLPGARDILRMESSDEGTLGKSKSSNSMSCTKKNCITAGLKFDESAMQKTYGMTKQLMKLYVPIECPRMTMTRNGVLRPWTHDVNFSQRQANAMQRLLREEFWKAVADFNEEYSRKMGGRKYPAVEMIEAFCKETKTPDLYVEAMRREWQRRQKRQGS